MAIIGKSKDEDLLERILDQDTKYREEYYKKYNIPWTQQPLVQKDLPGLSEGTPGSPDMGNTRVLIPIQSRIDDVQRITKLLGTGPGVTWLAHQTELETIQKQLADRRHDSRTSTMGARQNFFENFTENTLNLAKHAGSAMLDSATLTATMLGQVAVAGTGYHTSPFSDRSYSNGDSVGSLKNVLGDLVGGVTLTSAGNAALEGEPVTVKPGYAIIADDEGKQTTGHDITTFDGLRTLQKEQLLRTEEKTTTYSRVEKSKFSRLDHNTYSPSTVFAPGSEYYGNHGESLKNTIVTDDEGKQTTGYDIATPSGIKESLSNINFQESKVKESKFNNLQNNTYGPGKSSESSSYRGKYTNLLKVDSNEFNTGSKYNRQGLEKSIPRWEPSYAHSLEAKNATKDPRGTLDMVPNSEVDPSGSRIEMVPFWIQAIAPEGSSYGINDRSVLYFEANLSSYNDSYSSTWDSINYVGRADKFYTYTGFERQIDFGFKVVAKTRDALRPIYNRLNGLVALTAPTYASDGAFMRGTFAKIRIGDLLTGDPGSSTGIGQTGFIKSVKLSWQTDYQWETDHGYLQVPHVLDASISFTPIHTFIPQDRVRYYNLVDLTRNNKENITDAPLFIGNRRKMYYPDTEKN